jgi:polar amino acid transport system substrate-binding protein
MPFRFSTPVRIIGPATFLLAALVWHAVPSRAAQADDHQAALAALSDLRAAINELVQGEASFSTNRNDYHRSSQRAINALEGSRGNDYSAAAGNPGDADGSIGHIDRLLDRKETPVWAGPLHGAQATMRAAVAQLRDATRARELMDWQYANSRALVYLQVAEGRSGETGVLGGLQGALATTVLGVPGDARQVDGCAPPPDTAAYGVHDGYIAWISLPDHPGEYRFDEMPGAADLSVQSGIIVLHTAAAPLVTQQCRQASTAPAQPTPQPATLPAAQHAGMSSGLPALYTQDQARAGAQVFATKCVSCHGSTLQGVAAPSVAGTDFLKTAQQNGWTLEVIRYLVFRLMPLNASGSLSPTQYADVMAFLLASNCYPAGSTPFPSEDQPSFATVKLGPVPGHAADQNKLGVCSLQ